MVKKHQNFVQTFRKNLWGPIFKSQAVQEIFLTHEEGTDNLFRNIGSQLPFKAAKNSRMAQI